jgi:protein-S-isoprenylcysteine O-methyltransferase Ste14
LNLSLIWKILLYGWTASEILLALITRTGKKDGRVLDRWSLPVLWSTIAVSITASEFVAAWEPAPIFPGVHGFVFAAFALMVAGLMVRWTAIFSLGKAFSVNVAIRSGQRLYQSGLYRLVRHPSYAGMLLCFVAIALATRNWYSAAIVIVLPTLALLYRIHVEETALHQAFGEQYALYCQGTRRLIPGIY